MKAIIAVVALSAISTLAARAEGEASPQVVKAPTETIEVAPESSTGLFERVREAHIRAIHKGALAAKGSA